MSRNTCADCRYFTDSSGFTQCNASPPVFVEALALSFIHRNPDASSDAVMSYASRMVATEAVEFACRFFEGAAA